MSALKTAYFVLIGTSKGRKVLSGPYPTYAAAQPAEQEINANLIGPRFAFIRRTANAKMTAEWIAQLRVK